MAEANLSQLAYIAESTWGTTPGTPELTELRITNDSLAHSKQTITSNELRADRMRADLVQVAASAQGSVGFELSYATFDPFLESAFYSAFVTLNEASTAAINHTSHTITGSASDFDNVPVGGWVKVAGSATAANNGIKRVIAKNGDGSVLTFVAGSFTATTAGESITITGGDLRNGTTEKSFTMERKIVHSGTNYFQVFRGMVVSEFQLNVAVQAIATGSMTFIGTTGVPGSATIDNAGGVTASNTNPVMNGTANVGTVYFDDYSATTPTATAMSEKISEFNLTINNNIRGLNALGTLGNFDLGAGAFTVEGSMTLYFANNTFWSDFIDHTYKSFSFSITDGDGNTYVITLPRVNFSEANPALEGIDTDVMQTVNFTAIRDSLSGAALIINKFDA